MDGRPASCNLATLSLMVSAASNLGSIGTFELNGGLLVIASGVSATANELTLTGWDPVSKQPYYKYAAVQVRKAGGASLTEAIADVRADMRAYLQENFLYMHPNVELKDEDDFLAVGIIDSLGFVELVEEVQSRYGLTIEDIEITEENFGSIKAISEFVASKQSS